MILIKKKKKNFGLTRKLAGKHHAEYVFTGFDPGNTGMTLHKPYVL